jgi:hypothetical protein
LRIFRWRGSFIITGGTGLIFGFLTLMIIKEPKRGRFDPAVGEKPNITSKGLILNYIQAFIEIFKNPCSRWIIVAGCLRFWAGNAVSYFTGKYFNIF